MVVGVVSRDVTLRGGGGDSRRPRRVNGTGDVVLLAAEVCKPECCVCCQVRSGRMDCRGGVAGAVGAGETVACARLACGA